MDGYNNQTGQSNSDPTSSSTPGSAGSATGTAARMIAGKAAQTKETVADLGRKAAEKLDDSRESAAGALDRTASSLHSGSDQLSGAVHSAADQVSGVAHSTADKIQATADYVRRTDLQGMASDVQDLVKRYPGQSLAVAAVLGFLVARGLRSSD